ncbi:MAG: hypothetical protein AB7V48_00805 [Sedimentibacter sp.]
MGFNKPEIACKNIFKNCDELLMKKEFNQKLIELINQIENDKNKTTIVYKSDLQIISHDI